MTIKAKRDISKKLRILNHARQSGNVSKTCRYFGISREIFYQWKRAYEALGETPLINSKPCPQNPKGRVPQAIEEKILHLRKNYRFGPQRISWYLDRYHKIRVSTGGVRGVLIRNGMRLLPRNAGTKTQKSLYKLYSKQVPGHHVQVDVKFLN